MKKTLSIYNISNIFFGKFFGIKVINYAYGVIHNTKELGDCPIISVLLSYFKNKEIPLEDIFIICVNLKNTILKVFMKKGILDLNTFEEISILMDKNFYGVIQYYQNEYNKEISCDINSNIHSNTSISAKEFHNELQIDNEIMEELLEIEKETNYSLEFSLDISEETKDDVIRLFEEYEKIINQLVEFKEISYSLLLLIELFKSTEESIISEKSSFLKIYIKAIISDLACWRNNVFIDKSIDDIHYLDKTLLSSISQLQSMLSPELESETEIEFF